MERYISSCDLCLRHNKCGNKKAAMVERPIVCEPFETVCVDLVGPLPKGKRGCKYILTYICLATRWPDGVPLRSGSASEVADALITVFTKLSFPLKILSDRGSVFLSKVLKQLYDVCGVKGISTSPYRPQSNGIVERLHGTLKLILAKAAEHGVGLGLLLTSSPVCNKVHT